LLSLDDHAAMLAAIRAAGRLAADERALLAVAAAIAAAFR